MQDELSLCLQPKVASFMSSRMNADEKMDPDVPTIVPVVEKSNTDESAN